MGWVGHKMAYPMSQKPVIPPAWLQMGPSQMMTQNEVSPEQQALMQEQQMQAPDPAASDIAQMDMQSAAPEAQPPTSPMVQDSGASSANMATMKRLEAQINAERKRSFGESQKGINDYQDQINQAQTEKLGYDVRPIAALVDNLTGGNTYKAAEALAPKTPDEKRKAIADMKLKLHSLKGDMSKEQLANLKELLDSAKAQLASETSDNKMRTLLGSKERGLDLREGAEARRSVNNDQMLKLYTPRLEGAAKIGELITAAKEGKVVKNSAFLGQLNKEVAQLETGSQNPGLGQAEKTELLDKKAQYQAIIDSYLGDPEDAVRPKVINAIEKQISELAGSYKNAIDGRMDMLKAGATPVQQQIIQDKHDSIKKMYAPRLGGWGTENSAPKSNGLSSGEQKRLEELRAKVGK